MPYKLMETSAILFSSSCSSMIFYKGNKVTNKQLSNALGNDGQRVTHDFCFRFPNFGFAFTIVIRKLLQKQQSVKQTNSRLQQEITFPNFDSNFSDILPKSAIFSSNLLTLSCKIQGRGQIGYKQQNLKIIYLLENTQKRLSYGYGPHKVLKIQKKNCPAPECSTLFHVFLPFAPVTSSSLQVLIGSLWYLHLL